MSQNLRRISGISYPLELPIRYETLDGKRVTGTGRTQSVSSDIMRIECDQPLAAYCKIRLVVAWPAVLPDGTGLNLWIQGEVLKSASQRMTVKVIRYEFRTRRPVQSARKPIGETPLQDLEPTAAPGA